MKLKKFWILSTIGFVCFLTFWLKTSIYNQKPYAEIRRSKSGEEYQVLVCAMRWRGLLGHAGFEGYRYCVGCCLTLDGKSNVYKNPPIHINGYGTKDLRFFGTVKVDFSGKLVNIDLAELISTNNGTNFYRKIDLNGTYPIKDINDQEFDDL